MNPINIAITLFKVFTARKSKYSSVNGAPKQWYQSKGITGNVAAILGTIGAWYGLDVPVEQLTTTLSSLAVVVANLVSMWGRIDAKSEINVG